MQTINKAKSLDVIAGILRVNDPIDIEMGNGFKKFVVGGYDEYKMARDAREQLPNQVVENAS